MNYYSNTMKLMMITVLNYILIYILCLGKKTTNYRTVKVLHDLYHISLNIEHFQKSSKCTFVFFHFMDILINVSPKMKVHFML